MKTRNRITKIATATVAAITIAALCFPFKAKADELSLTRGTAAQLFYQTNREQRQKVGIGFDSTFSLRDFSLGLGTSVVSELGKGNTSLERAGLSFGFPLPFGLSATTYAQIYQFLGGQRAFGGVLHLPLGQVTLQAGGERDVAGATPVFAGADFPIGPVLISPTAIAPMVDGQDYPNLGGTVKLTWKTKVANFFLQVFGMTNPEKKELLAGNVQAGVEIPIN
ncbi:MAG: hypothetical protein ABII22_02290 [Candidatus Micrarchaeota archaeon]